MKLIVTEFKEVEVPQDELDKDQYFELFEDLMDMACNNLKDYEEFLRKIDEWAHDACMGWGIKRR